MKRDPRPDLKPGDVVKVSQPGLRPWKGEVIAIKPGHEAWHVEVRNSDSIVWSLPAHRVRT